MIKIEYPLILDIVTRFYEKANFDILIGYHFRVIEDFDTHLPRIASFWQLQLTGSIDQKSELPFDIINLHKALKINKGEVFRWVMLFDEILEEYVSQKKISPTQYDYWMEKIELFKNRILAFL